MNSSKTPVHRKLLYSDLKHRKGATLLLCSVSNSGCDGREMCVREEGAKCVCTACCRCQILEETLVSFALPFYRWGNKGPGEVKWSTQNYMDSLLVVEPKWGPKVLNSNSLLTMPSPSFTTFPRPLKLSWLLALISFKFATWNPAPPVLGTCKHKSANQILSKIKTYDLIAAPITIAKRWKQGCPGGSVS